MKLDWTIQPKRGSCFEGDSQEEAIKSMIEYYAENEESPDNIREIYACCDGEIVQQVSQEEISKIEMRIEREVNKWIKEVEIEAEGFNEIRSDYYANLI